MPPDHRRPFRVCRSDLAELHQSSRGRRVRPRSAPPARSSWPPSTGWTHQRRGSTGDIYRQNSRNFAAFTHNIFHVTDKFDLTVGARYTNERKKLDAKFHNDNLACAEPGRAWPFLTNAGLAPTACRRDHRLDLPRQYDGGTQ